MSTIQLGNGQIQIGGGGQPQIIYQQQNQDVHVIKKDFRGDDQCKLFIGGLNHSTQKSSFDDYFSQFGEIVDSIIMTDKVTQQPRGFGFVTYKTQDEVDNLLNYGKPHVLDGKQLQVRKYFPKAEFNERRFANNKDDGFRAPMRISPELKIFVGGIAPGTDEEDVKRYFSDFGTVVGVNMPKDHVTHNPRGFAFVGFETSAVVADVTRDRYHQINGKTVEVKGCDEQGNRRGGSGGSHNSGQNQAIQSVVPTVQNSQSTQALLAAYQQQYLAQTQLLGGATAAGTAGYTVIPPGYSIDPLTGTIYQAAAVPGAIQTGATNQLQLQQLQTLGGLQGLAGQQQLAGQQYTLATASQATAAGVAQAAPAYQQIALGQYGQESSAFGAQRITVPGSVAGTQIAGTEALYAGGALSGAVTDPSTGIIYAANPAATAGAGDQRSSSGSARSFHPYGR